MKALLFVPGGLFLLFWAAAFGLFRFALGRSRAGDDLSAVHYAPLKPYAAETLAGISWFLGKNPEQVSIRTKDGLRLQGFYLEHPAARGTMVLVHGYHSSWAMDFGCILPFYYEQGFSILTYWQRSHGESEGKYVCFGVKERDDCLRFVQFLCARIPETQPVFLDGVSMGAATVLMAAGEPLPKNVRGIIADSGFTSPWDQFAYLLRRAHVPIHPLLDAVNLLAKWLAGLDFRAYSTKTALAQTKLPILLVHGENDTYVSPRFSAENYEACAGERTLVTVPGAAHGMSYLVDRNVCQAGLISFLEQHLGAAESLQTSS